MVRRRVERGRAGVTADTSADVAFAEAGFAAAVAGLRVRFIAGLAVRAGAAGGLAAVADRTLATFGAFSAFTAFGSFAGFGGLAAFAGFGSFAGFGAFAGFGSFGAFNGFGAFVFLTFASPFTEAADTAKDTGNSSGGSDSGTSTNMLSGGSEIVSDCSNP